MPAEVDPERTSEQRSARGPYRAVPVAARRYALADGITVEGGVTLFPSAP